MIGCEIMKYKTINKEGEDTDEVFDTLIPKR
jgi:hypothetical protein